MMYINIIIYKNISIEYTYKQAGQKAGNHLQKHTQLKIFSKKQ